MSTEARRHDRPEVGRDQEDPRALEEAIEAGHEVDTVGSRILWLAAIAFTTLLVLGVITVYLVQPFFVSLQEASYPPPNPLAESYGRVEPPAPRLQVDPALDIYDHRKAEERLLTTYGWVDEKAGTVRIPIERAIELLAERGLPAVPPAPQPSAAPAPPASGPVSPPRAREEGAR